MRIEDNNNCPCAMPKEPTPIKETSSLSALYFKSPFLQSLAFTCLAGSILPASAAVILLGSTLFTLVRYPQLFHKGFLYEAALIDLIARDKFSLYFPTVNHQWWHKITDHLILGGIPLKNFSHLKLLHNLGVNAVCSVLEEFELSTETFFSKPVSVEDWDQLKIDHILFSCEDMKPMDLTAFIRAIDWVYGYTSKKQTVYIHCKQGRGRSACITLGYLIRYSHMTLEEAYRTVMQIRPVISLKSNQLLMLKEFEVWNRSHPFSAHEPSSDCTI